MAALAVIGAAGWSLTTQSEGLRFKTYRDPVGIPTVCYGHTGPDVRMGQVYTQAQCDTILIADIKTHQPVFLPGNRRNCIGNVPITLNQRDALTDFTINVGTGRFCKSGIARRLRVRDYNGAANEFLKWQYAGGRVLPGLHQRRLAERELFLSNQRSEPSTAISGRAKALLMRLS